MKDSDEEILQRVRAGEPEAYAELVGRHHQNLLRLCGSLLGDSAQAEDAAAEVFLKAYRSIAGFHGDSSFSTWLYRIASNHCLNLLKKRTREKSESLEALLAAAGERGLPSLAEPDSASDALEQREFLEALLSGLSPEYRMALTLRELQGFNYGEIADAMHCSLDSVKARLRRARAQLAEQIRHFEDRKNV